MGPGQPNLYFDIQNCGHFDQKSWKRNSKNSKLWVRQLQQIVVSFQPWIFDQRHVEVRKRPNEVQVGTDRVFLRLGSEQVNNRFLDILRDVCEAGFWEETSFLINWRVIVSLNVSTLFRPQFRMWSAGKQLQITFAFADRLSLRLLLLQIRWTLAMVFNPSVLWHLCGVTALSHLSGSL